MFQWQLITMTPKAMETVKMKVLRRQVWKETHHYQKHPTEEAIGSEDREGGIVMMTIEVCFLQAVMFYFSALFWYCIGSILCYVLWIVDL